MVAASSSNTHIRLHLLIGIIFFYLSGSSVFAQDTGNKDPVHFFASDSLTFSFAGERKAELFGNARVEHPKGQLEAGRISLDLNMNLMSAQTITPGDTLSEPRLSRGDDVIRSRRILYNYETDKGKFDVARISIDQGNLLGDQVKRTAPHVIFVEDGRYSTCELDHPHYYILANRMKVVDEDEVFFTRARLYILDIPYPIIFPFGLIPSGVERRRSGLLEPTYVFQDDFGRGLGLQNFGWFQYFNDHLTGRASVDVFTSGTYFFNARTDYRVVNRYNGNIGFGYSRDQGMEPTDPDYTQSIQRSLNVSHSQQVSPYSNFGVNINLRTSEFYRRNSYDIEDRAEVTTGSNLSYSYRDPESRFNLSVSSRVNQNFANNSTTLSGPNINFSSRRFTPFSTTGQRGQQRWYETLNINYSNAFQSQFSYTPPIDLDDAPGFFDVLTNPNLYRETTGNTRHINYGFRQRMDMSTQLLSSQFVNLSTNTNFVEYWYPETIRRFYNEETERVEEESVPGFAAARDFSTGLSLSTTLYGIAQTQIGRVEAFRHTFRPSLSYSYSPDFGDEFWGFYRSVEGLPEGQPEQIYSIFQGSVIGGPSRGEQQAISLSLNNIFEAKVVRRDSTGERSEQNLRIIDNLSASLSYNFAAEQFKLSDLNTRISSTVYQNIRLNASANFSFYDTDDNGARIDQYLWEENNGFLRLTNFTLTASSTFQGGSGGMPQFTQSTAHFPRYYDPFDQSMFRTIDATFNRAPIEPLRAPWSFSLSFNYDWRIGFNNEVTQRAILNAQNIRVRLTPEWNVGTSLGYDFIQGELTPTRFNVTRNLHCWDLMFEWNPFGDFQFYMFTLRLRDSQMHSLFQKLPGLNNLERSSSPIGRGF